MQDNDAESHEGELALKVAGAPYEEELASMRSTSKPHSPTPVSGSAYEFKQSKSEKPKTPNEFSSRPQRQRLLEREERHRRSRSRSRSKSIEKRERHDGQDDSHHEDGEKESTSFNKMKRF